MALILIFTAVACQPADTPLAPSATPMLAIETPPLPSATPTPHGEEAPPATAPATETTQPDPSREAEKMILLAQTDLAGRLSISEEEILVQSVEPVTWTDAGLGCPQPGQAYAQVLTPGFRVILEADGQVYEYHTGEPERIILCREEGSTMEDTPIPGAVEPAGSVEPGLESFIVQAREDLAQRLSVDDERITVLEAKAVVWPDSSLGCPQPGMQYKQVPQDGFLIRLVVGGSVYEYHGGGGREMFLCEQPLKLEKEAPPKLDLFQLTPGSPDD
jgi:hypothetical protein